MLFNRFFAWPMTIYRKLSRRFALYRKTLSPVNSLEYWNARFSSDWGSIGPLQTSIFAAAFCISDTSNALHNVNSVLDFGCGTGDSAPALQMKFPDASISLYDFSVDAREIQKNRYGDFCTIVNSLPACRQFDLVYCSNVVEHVYDLPEIIKQISFLADKYIVIQAPWNERHNDGQFLSKSRPLHEHINTIDEHFVHLLPNEFIWSVQLVAVPFAWKKGLQAFFLGERRLFDLENS